MILFDLDLVSAFSGDRKVTKEEKQYFKALKSQLNAQFFVNPLFALTHQYFPGRKRTGIMG